MSRKTTRRRQAALRKGKLRNTPEFLSLVRERVGQDTVQSLASIAAENLARQRGAVAARYERPPVKLAPPAPRVPTRPVIPSELPRRHPVPAAPAPVLPSPVALVEPAPPVEAPAPEIPISPVKAAELPAEIKAHAKTMTGLTGEWSLIATADTGGTAEFYVRKHGASVRYGMRVVK